MSTPVPTVKLNQASAQAAPGPPSRVIVRQRHSLVVSRVRSPDTAVQRIIISAR